MKIASVKIRAHNNSALKAVTAELKTFDTISVIKRIERLKTGYTLRELVFADFTGSD